MEISQKKVKLNQNNTPRIFSDFFENMKMKKKTIYLGFLGGIPYFVPKQGPLIHEFPLKWLVKKLIRT